MAKRTYWLTVPEWLRLPINQREALLAYLKEQGRELGLRFPDNDARDLQADHDEEGRYG